MRARQGRLCRSYGQAGPYNVRMRRFLLLLVTCLLSTGCAGDRMASIDREITAMLRQQHFETLGPAAPMDEAVEPTSAASAALSPKSYDRHPATRNPPAADLPARRADNQQPAISDAKTDIAAVADTKPVIFDLGQALAYGVEHSRDYRNRKDELFLAAIALLIERHLWGPRFFNDMTAQFTGTPEGGDHDHAFTLINDLRATQRLPYGGQIAASAVVAFVEQLRTAAGSETDDSQTLELKLEATIPLLRGAGKVAQEDLIQAYRDIVYATRNFERYRQQFLLDVATDYFDLLLQTNQIHNVELQVANLEALSKRMDALATAGRVPYIDVQQSQQQVLFARNRLLAARERFTNVLDSFKISIGMATTAPLELKPVELQSPIPHLNAVEAIKTAWAMRLDLQTAEDVVDDARRRVEVARNNQLPDLSLNASVSVPTDGSKRRGGVDLDAGSGRYAVGMTYGAPLDRRVEQLDYRRSLIVLERVERSHLLLKDQIALAVRRSMRDIELAQSTLALQLRNLELAEKRSEGVQLRQRTLQPRDVIDAEDDLRDARDARDQAIRDQRVSVLTYLLETGQMRVTGQGHWLPPTKLVPAK